MFEETGSLVECSVCETEFDPSAAGGWCTNPDCGEWKYEGEDVPDAGAEPDEADVDDPLAEPETPAATDPSEYTAAEIAGEAETEELAAGGTTADERDADDSEPVSDGSDPDADSDEAIDETVDKSTESEAEDEPAAVEDDEPSEAEDDEPSEADDEPSEAEDDQPPEITCPGCAETLEAAVEFCPNCGADVSGVEQTSEDELAECPACGDDVDADDSFCATCGENLDEHRGSTLLTECPDCGVSVDEDDSFCASCGEDLDAHRDRIESAETDSEPDSLVLETRGREIGVSDGEIVGRELRKIITETGGEENDAVRIHREHIRFVREDGQFYLVDLGENPTAVNGHTLSKGDREPVSDGDTITLSDVVTLSVTAP